MEKQGTWRLALPSLRAGPCRGHSSVADRAAKFGPTPEVETSVYSFRIRRRAFPELLCDPA